MLAKTIILVAMFVILFALGSSLYFLIRDKGKSARTKNALTWRIALSLGLFFFLFLAFCFGYIHPHAMA